ncbi:MAG TPA: hypothetical protein DCW68_04550 [Rhodospirillaceae bacterium]|nr:MAG: hypothetical protein A2018_03100 [Alphaproteobacteria bacterium GWF2_58_20]HAU29367.1 hypothetical protein [Rhodospirillaceae bacterium]
MKFSKKDLLRNLGAAENTNLGDDESIMVEMVSGELSETGKLESVQRRSYAEIKQMEGTSGTIISAKIVTEKLEMAQEGIGRIQEAASKGEFNWNFVQGIQETIHELHALKDAGEIKPGSEDDADMKDFQKIERSLKKNGEQSFPVIMPVEMFLEILEKTEGSAKLSSGAETFFAQAGSPTDMPIAFSADYVPFPISQVFECAFSEVVLPSGYLRNILAGKADPDEMGLMISMADQIIEETKDFIDQQKCMFSDVECFIVAQEVDDEVFVMAQTATMYNKDFDDAQMADLLTAFRYSATQISEGKFSNFTAIHCQVWSHRLRQDMEQKPQWKSTLKTGMDLKEDFGKAAKKSIGFKPQKPVNEKSLKQKALQHQRVNKPKAHPLKAKLRSMNQKKLHSSAPSMVPEKNK